MTKNCIILLLHFWTAFLISAAPTYDPVLRPESTFRCTFEPDTFAATGSAPEANRFETAYFHTDQHPAAPMPGGYPIVTVKDTINAACTSEHSTLPDPLRVELVHWQMAGDLEKIEKKKENLERELAGSFFGKKTIQTQIDKVNKILQDPMTKRLHIIKTGTLEEALQAIKKIRRLSPFKYATQFPGMPGHQQYLLRLEQHIAARGYDLLDKAELLLEARSDYQEKMGPTLRTTLRHGEAPREFGFTDGKAPDGSILGDVTLGSPIAEQLAQQSNVPIGKHEDVTDMVTTTATDAALVQEYLAKSVKDRGARLDQLHELLSAAAQTGAMTAERCVSITHAFLEGALVDPLVATVDTVLHPIQAAQNIAEGAMKLADEIGPFMIDVFSAPDAEFPTAADMQAHKERLQARAESMSKTYAACMEHIAGLTSEQKARLVGNITGQILLGKYGPQVAGKAAEGGVSFVGTALNETPFLQEVMGQLSKGAQVALPEGVAVSASSAAKTAAEIAADAKAATAAAQAVAKGASAASAASDAGNLLRQDNQSTPGGGDKGVSKEAVQLSVASEKLSVHQEWFDIAEKVEKRLPQAEVRSVTPTDLQKYLKYEQEAEMAYEQIRQTDDILKIAKNTGLPKEMIHRVKNHVFFETHNLKHHGQRRFFADGDMAAAWSRLQNNQAFSTDILMLKHELAESIFKESFQLPHDPTHELTNVFYDWNKSLS